MRTAAFPAGEADLPERFRGRPARDLTRCPGCAACQAGLDAGASRFAPEEAEACPNGAIAFTRDYRMGSATRDGLRSPSGEIALAQALEERTRKLFGRSLRLRSVAAGSCGGCEAELVALGNVVFDMARFGIQFVASPRHADGIVLSGAVSANMRDAVYRTYEATPEPKLVIVVGACAIDGGPFRGSPEVSNGAPADLPVDLWLPGCPPHPLTVLDGLLRLLGKISDRPRS
jgi:Ni,Fe-hydrogenase III small subunit